MEKERQTFTEEDKEALERLPSSESFPLYMRFSELMQRKRIIDDRWETDLDALGEDLDQLVRDVKTKLNEVK